MTPFQELRLWARRAPTADRAGSVIASVLVVGALVWLGVPASTSSTGGSVQSSAFPGDQAGGAAVDSTGAAGTGAAATTGGSAGATGTSAATGTGAAGTSAASSGGAVTGTTPGQTTAGTTSTTGTTSGTAARTTTAGTATKKAAATPTKGTTSSTASTSCPSSTAKGVTAKQLSLAFVIVNVVGPTANSAFGIATPADQKKYFQGVIDDVNKGGGIACRQVVPTYYEANAIDQNDLATKCADITSSGAFAVIDGGAYAQYPLISCFAQAHMPYFGSYLLAGDLQRQFYPYLFDFNTLDALYKDTVYALAQRGAFSASSGFKELGFIYRSCNPAVIKAMQGWLVDVGVPAAKTVTYDVGCPSALANPSDLQQAVLKFSQAGVTHVITAGFVGDFPNFTKIAQQENFKPQYVLPDDNLISTSYGGQPPNYANINGAIAISASRDGEEETAGVTPSAGTQKCNAIHAKDGYPPVYTHGQEFAGYSCDVIWMFKAAADHVSSLTVSSLADGLAAAKSVDFSYPLGPSDFTKPGTTYGGQAWRPTQFTTACNCWKLTDTTFHHTFS